MEKTVLLMLFVFGCLNTTVFIAFPSALAQSTRRFNL